MIIYYLMEDNGDGSCSLRFYRTAEAAEAHVDEDGMWPNEGYVSTIDTDNIHYKE